MSRSRILVSVTAAAVVIFLAALALFILQSFRKEVFGRSDVNERDQKVIRARNAEIADDSFLQNMLKSGRIVGNVFRSEECKRLGSGETPANYQVKITYPMPPSTADLVDKASVAGWQTGIPQETLVALQTGGGHAISIDITRRLRDGSRAEFNLWLESGTITVSGNVSDGLSCRTTRSR